MRKPGLPTSAVQVLLGTDPNASEDQHGNYSAVKTNYVAKTNTINATNQSDCNQATACNEKDLACSGVDR